MQRLRRLILNALTVLSLLLCVATLALWVRSYWYGDVLIASRANGQYVRVMSVRGLVSFSCDNHFPYAHDGWLRYRFDMGHFVWEPPKTIASDGRVWRDVPDVGPLPDVPALAGSLPHSVIAALLAAPIVWVWGRRWFRSLRARRRSQAGRCPTCNYDLRATPDRCPECGTAIPAKAEG